MKRIPDLVKYIIPTNTAALTLLEEILKELPANSGYSLPLLLTDVVEHAWQGRSKHFAAKVNSLLRKHGIYPVAVKVPASRCTECKGTGTITRSCYICLGSAVVKDNGGKKCDYCQAGVITSECYSCDKGIVPGSTTWRFDAQVRRLPMQGW